MKKNFSSYWLSQLGGWGAYMLVWTFFYFALRTKPLPHFFEILFTDACIGILITHSMRLFIKAFGLVNISLQKQITAIIVMSFVFAIIYSMGVVAFQTIFEWNPDERTKLSFLNIVLRQSIFVSLFLLIWNLIYFIYHYIQKSRQQQLDKIRLESLVKELKRV